MIKSGIVIVLLLLATAAGGYYYYGYAPEIYKRATQQALDDFSTIVATKDRAKIGIALKNLLTDDAKIRLEVSFVSLSQMQGSKPEIEDFDTPTLLTFIDNTIYSLQDYGISAQIREFRLAHDKKAASVIFASQEWGTSESSYGETHISMRSIADTVCEGHVVFSGIHPTIDNADCKIQLRSLPIQGQEKKMMQSPEALKQLLR